jgi:hypothetical protein
MFRRRSSSRHQVRRPYACTQSHTSARYMVSTIRMVPRNAEPYAICVYQLSIPYLLTSSNLSANSL